VTPPASHSPAGAAHDQAASRLAAQSQRLTASRARIVAALAEAGRPLTIPELLERAPGLAQSSAYRNLVVLESAGVVRRVVTPDEFTRYELGEALTEHHHHLVCLGCGVVQDIAPTSELERSLQDAVSAAAASSGFRVEHHQLDLLGRCAACR